MIVLGILFESFVNSERCKTICASHPNQHRLRALLIQKDVKPYQLDKTANGSLRALLIQEDVKRYNRCRWFKIGLRALLIQKDVKLPFRYKQIIASLRALLIQKDVKQLSLEDLMKGV